MRLVDWLLWFGYFVAFVSIVTGWTWTVTLYIAGSRYVRRWRGRGLGREEVFLWIFLVPALNEGVTVADSVDRLIRVQATNKVMLVINDGSDDDTGEVLAGIHDPDLQVLTRHLPNARKGKAAALNEGIQFISRTVLTLPRYESFDADHVIVAIVDADGRLSPDAPGWVSRHFEDPRIGGVQVAVSIYNQSSWLTRMQQAEFEVFGSLLQVGRSLWGTAFMGGNGQFNRLSALESISVGDGPWDDFLTEDQELGLRLLHSGWRSEFARETRVEQQGLSSLRRLYKQRVRWMQGNLQVVLQFRQLYAYRLYGLRRFDALFTIILPVLQVIVGIALIMAIVLFVWFGVAFLPLDAPVLLAYTVMLSIGPLGLGILSVGRGEGRRGFWRGIKLFPSYYAYTYVMWPVAFIGLYQQLKGNKIWDKTAREAVKS